MLAQQSQERPFAEDVLAILDQVCQQLDNPNRGAQRLLLGLLLLAVGITAVFLFLFLSLP